MNKDDINKGLMIVDNITHDLQLNGCSIFNNQYTFESLYNICEMLNIGDRMNIITQCVSTGNMSCILETLDNINWILILEGEKIK